MAHINESYTFANSDWKVELYVQRIRHSCNWSFLEIVTGKYNYTPSFVFNRIRNGHSKSMEIMAGKFDYTALMNKNKQEK